MISRIKFTHPIGLLAVINGSVKLEADRLEFELAMTESIAGPVKNVIKRRVDLSDLESIKLRRRLFRKSSLDFTASSLLTFNDFPGSRGFAFSVLVESSHKDALSFVRNVLFDMTQIETEQLRERIRRPT